MMQDQHGRESTTLPYLVSSCYIKERLIIMQGTWSLIAWISGCIRQIASNRQSNTLGNQCVVHYALLTGKRILTVPSILTDNAWTAWIRDSGTFHMKECHILWVLHRKQQVWWFLTSVEPIKQT